MVSSVMDPNVYYLETVDDAAGAEEERIICPFSAFYSVRFLRECEDMPQD